MHHVVLQESGWEPLPLYCRDQHHCSASSLTSSWVIMRPPLSRGLLMEVASSHTSSSTLTPSSAFLIRSSPADRQT